MPKLKDYLNSDLKVFLNADEFATEHNIDGQDILCVIDEDRAIPNANDGVYVIRRHLFISQTDLGYIPIPDQKIEVDGKYYYVIDCIKEDLLEIILEARDS
ncbi:hypothetical protein [Pelosinus sp. UFO1]|uniref:hypothetical protein n=1 Tax=Pelosinus sp. UFO1 TaxID=484770 RepID=UPI0004D1C949|nr:hypothetical protein [Pelosinus sp. UFO1]AIF51252.1 hypothetical protein UFO1_1701 [Pelosinus sp. UFO1]